MTQVSGVAIRSGVGPAGAASSRSWVISAHHDPPSSTHRSSTPSRMAHGQMVSVSMPVSFIAVCPTTAPAKLCRARGADTGKHRPLGRGQGCEQGQTGTEISPAQLPCHEHALATGCGTAQPGQLLEGPRGRHRHVGPLPPEPCGHVPQLMAHPAAQRPQVLLGRRVLATEELPGQSARAERQ